MHNPPCDTWQVHLHRCYVELDRFIGLGKFIDDVLHTWEQELLVADPEFEQEFQRVTAETRAAMDAVA